MEEQNQNPVPTEQPDVPKEQPVTVDQPEALEPAQPVVSVHKRGLKHRFSKKSVFLILIIILLAGGGGVAWWLRKPKPVQQQTTTQQPAPETKKEEPKPADDPALAKFIKPTTGEVWLSQPKKIADQGYYADTGDIPVEYYEVGSHGDNTIIMSVMHDLGDDIRLYEKSKFGKVALITLPDGTNLLSEDQQASIKESTKSTITLDTTTHYDSLTLPAKLDLDKGYTVSKPSPAYMGDLVLPPSTASGTKYIEVKKFGQSTLQRTETTYADTKLTSIGYQVITPIGTAIRVGYEPIERELKSYQWQSGTSYVSDNMSAIARGCGGRLTSVTRSDALTDADTQLVGRSPSGMDIYGFKDPNNALLTKAYDEFIDFNRDTPDEPYAKITKPDFIKEHGVVLHKDKFGQWLVFVRDQLRPAYGCAKPIVYLYPQQATMVNVKVGADVKVSAPHYNPATGWNALALPGGKLITTSGIYDSLFWEGPGTGLYPGISEGTVVSHDAALSTVRAQLGQLGLNSKEITDFMTYWEPKLPNKPYVRLTWLTTEQMNELAPLRIMPQPDTVIRVFLDFAGLDAPVSLPPQHLTTTPRTGFTVVEWGGLSPTKLY